MMTLIMILMVMKVVGMMTFLILRLNVCTYKEVLGAYYRARRCSNKGEQKEKEKRNLLTDLLIYVTFGTGSIGQKACVQEILR